MEVLGSEEREWASVALVAVATILKVAMTVLGSVEKVGGGLWVFIGWLEGCGSAKKLDSEFHRQPQPTTPG